MHELLLDEEQSARLAEGLTTVLLKHLKVAVRDRQTTPCGLTSLTTNEASDYIGIIPGTLCQWRMSRDEKCPTYTKVGTRVFYLRKHLDEWLATWSVDNSRPVNSPHRFKRKIDLIPWEELKVIYTRLMEELERTDSDNPSVRWELWDWRRRLQEAE